MKTLLLAVLLLSPSFAAAETVTRWTPEQIEAAKEAAAVRNRNADNGVLTGSAPDRRIHGEMGAAIGTGGYRAFFGTAVMPLGQDGVVAFSFENSQADISRYYRRR